LGALQLDGAKQKQQWMLGDESRAVRVGNLFE
jgi:hypothetical protein